MSKRLDVDWQVIKSAYVSSNKSLATIAQEFAITPDAVEAQCTRGKWVAERRKLQEAADRELAAKAVALKLKALDEMNNNDVILSKAIKAQVSLKLQSSSVKDENGNVIGTNLNPRDIAALSTAHGNAQKAGRLAIGLSTENNAFAGTVLPAEPASIESADPVGASKTYQRFITGKP